jgi:hypothetical protein
MRYRSPSPEYTGSHPFSRGRRISKYKEDELYKEPGNNFTPRNEWFAEELLEIYRSTGRPVPYAFRTQDGKPRSLDAGCLSRLLKRDPPDLIPILDHEGYVDAVTPTTELRGRYAEVPAALPANLDPDAPIDKRRRKESLRVIREGAGLFRKQLLKSWSGKCAICDTRARRVLDGAHIFRFLGEHTNHGTNGILLRADIHRLFDAHLISLHFEEGNLVVAVSNALKNTEYCSLTGKSVKMPQDARHRPDIRLVEWHYQQFQVKNGTLSCKAVPIATAMSSDK